MVYGKKFIVLGIESSCDEIVVVIVSVNVDLLDLWVVL